MFSIIGLIGWSLLGWDLSTLVIFVAIETLVSVKVVTKKDNK